MHIQPAFAELQQPVLHELITSYPLGSLIMQGADGLEVNHMPFLLLTGRGAHGVLQAHFPRNNPLAKLPEQEVLVLFHGPNCYISPTWYPSKHQHGKAVPTWNYAVVHAYGTPRFITDKDWLLQHVSALTNTHEEGQASPWQVTDAPAEYIDRMLDNITGIEIPITRLSGKFKMSQNRSEADQLGVLAGLAASNSGQTSAVARLVKAKR